MVQLHDKYFKLAKKEGHLARSYYKLEELQRRNRLFRRGSRVLDLGACPGSWLEFILPVIGKEGVACAVDLNPIHKKFKGQVHFKKRDIKTIRREDFAGIAEYFEAIVSDMAPKTSGVKSADQARSLDLCLAAETLARKCLAPGGNFVCKILEGPDFYLFRDRVRPLYREIKTQKPAASRDESMETYLVCLGFGLPAIEKKPRGDKEPPQVKGKKKSRRKR